MIRFIGQNGGNDRDFSLPSQTGTLPYPNVKPFVVTTGTVYLFSPSVSALRTIGT